jgi:hypothetical protein
MSAAAVTAPAIPRPLPSPLPPRFQPASRHLAGAPPARTWPEHGRSPPSLPATIPVPAGKHSRRTTAPCDSITALPVGWATGSGRRGTRARRQPPAHHVGKHPDACQLAPSPPSSATNLLMKIVSTSSFVPMMSRHGHRRLLRVASPCLSLFQPRPRPTGGITQSEATANQRPCLCPLLQDFHVGWACPRSTPSRIGPGEAHWPGLFTGLSAGNPQRPSRWLVASCRRSGLALLVADRGCRVSAALGPQRAMSRPRL